MKEETDKNKEETLEAKAEESKSEAKAEESKPEAKESKPEAKAEESKPEAKAEESKPEAKAEESKPEAKAEESKPEAKAEESKLEAKAEESKLEAKAEESKPEAKAEENKPEAKAEEKTTAPKEKVANIENIQSMLGKKIGMTQIFTKSGDCLPVTLVELGPVEVLQKKTLEKDGYEALQVGFDELSQNKKKKLNKARQKQMPRKAYRYLKEIQASSIEKSQLGDFYDTSVFQVGNFVDVIGISKGKGFAGVMKRHNFSGGPKSHGSHFHRAPGSIGASAYPARVFKNRKMPGHYGNARTTVRGLEIVAIEAKDNLLAIKGAIPGSAGRLVEVKKSTKQK